MFGKIKQWYFKFVLWAFKLLTGHLSTPQLPEVVDNLDAKMDLAVNLGFDEYGRPIRNSDNDYLTLPVKSHFERQRLKLQRDKLICGDVDDQGGGVIKHVSGSAAMFPNSEAWAGSDLLDTEEEVIVCPGCQCEDNCFCECKQCPATSKLRRLKDVTTKVEWFENPLEKLSAAIQLEKAKMQLVEEVQQIVSRLLATNPSQSSIKDIEVLKESVYHCLIKANAMDDDSFWQLAQKYMQELRDFKPAIITAEEAPKPVKKPRHLPKKVLDRNKQKPNRRSKKAAKKR